ncbi:MAG: hypothetical protein PHX18_06370 [Candidatus Gastranaerophilales bacterium]|nr:hypothetical protein [Candidatus Gastranaerophilales bacterium]
MKIVVRVKKLLLDLQITMTELAAQMSKRLNKKYSMANLSNKLRNETISFKEMELIADILGYKIEFTQKDK